MDFSYWRKGLLYVLTFLTYTYAGFGAGLIGNLRDAVGAAERFFDDYDGPAEAIGHLARTVKDIFNAAVEETCEFKCPRGVQPVKRRNFVPQSNGCGTLGFKIEAEYLPMAEMTKCCDAHDICYDTCNSDRDHCDLQFKRCLYKYCDGYITTGKTVVNTCKAAAKMLYSGTTTLGCKSWVDAQKASCYCGDDKPNNGKHQNGRKGAQAGGEL